MTDRVDCMIGLLALFGRRIEPTVLVELYEDLPTPSTAPQESVTNIPSIAPREDPAGVPSAITQENLVDTPSATPHEDQTGVPPTVPQDCPASIQPTDSAQRVLPMPGAYDVNW